MLVPPALRDLDEPHAGFEQLASHQALPAEPVGAAAAHSAARPPPPSAVTRADAVERERVLRFLRLTSIALRQFGLHPKGEFVALDQARRWPGSRRSGREAVAVERLQEVELRALVGEPTAAGS